MITLEVLDQQIELQAMYRDDKFAAKLKELQTQYKSTQDAQKALDDREKALAQREKMCGVITASQTAFNDQKEAAEARNLEDSQHNQTVKDDLSKQAKAVARTKNEAATMKEEAESLMRSAKSRNGQAEAKLRKASEAEAAAEEYKVAYAKRLSDLGLKAA